MRWVLIFALMLAGCSVDKVEEAKARYEIVQRHGNNGEICKATREVADAYLEAKDEQEYELWRAMAAVECTNAELVGPGTYPERDIVPLSETPPDLESGSPPPG